MSEIASAEVCPKCGKFIPFRTFSDSETIRMTLEDYQSLEAELAAVRKREAVLMDLLRQHLERMQLINGGKLHCKTGTRPCPNHNLIEETERFFEGRTER